MSAAPGYTPTTSFANDETNSVAGRSTVKTVSLDTECANIASSINALNTNLKIIQRDDGKLKDFSVEPYALSEQARSLVATGGNPRGLWVTLTQYAIADVVQFGSIAYLCYVEHTSTGVFDNSKFIAISGDGQAAYHAAQAATSDAKAATSATTAATQATNAANSATSAATQATNAATSASNASTNAGIALGHANNASTSATNAALSYDSFDDRYLGTKAANPSTDNDGNTLLTGAFYWNTTTPGLHFWNGTGWVQQPINAQPLDTTLTALAALDASVGVIHQTGADTFEKRGIATNSDVTLGKVLGIGWGGLGADGAMLLTDWNAGGGNGMLYMSQTATNAPITGWLIGTYHRHNGTHGTQFLSTFTLSVPRSFIRSFVAGVWQAWREVQNVPVGGQTWQDVTAARAKDTTYTNTTGAPIQLAIRWAQSASEQSILTVSGMILESAQQITIAGGGTHWAIVPVDATYSLTGANTLVAWYELR